jgi:hypothetical protein
VKVTTDDIRNVMMFRLLFSTQDDHFDGDVAAHLLAGLRNLDDESAAASITLAAMDAEGELVRN